MYKVLIVDDEKIIRIALKSMINWNEQGFMVCGSASNCNSALEILRDQTPHLLIVDIMMPDMDGITFIKQLRSSGFKGEIILLSNHQSFEYAVDALHNKVFDYILKTDISPENLISVLQKVKAVLDKNISDFYDNKEITKQTDYNLFETILKKPDTLIPDRFLVPYLFLEIFVRSRLLRQKKETSVPQEALNSIIQETIEITDCFVLPLSQDASLILVPQQEHIHFLSSLDTFARKISNLIHLYMNTDCGFICTEAFDNTTTFSEKLQKLPELEKLVLYYGFTHIIHESDLEHYTLCSVQLSSFILSLKEAFASEDYALCKKLIAAIISSFKENGYNTSTVHKTLSNIYSFLIFDNSTYLEESHNKLKRIACQYHECCTLDEYVFLLNELIDLISSNKFVINMDTYRDEVKAVDAFIENNMNKKITLPLLAQHVNRSENYLSRIFKAETGINIINYINTKKMQRAKVLLMNPQMSISEISHSLGFEDASYFNKIFNKIYDINPSDYRKTVISTLKSFDT